MGAGCSSRHSIAVVEGKGDKVKPKPKSGPNVVDLVVPSSVPHVILKKSKSSPGFSSEDDELLSSPLFKSFSSGCAFNDAKAGHKRALSASSANFLSKSQLSLPLSTCSSVRSMDDVIDVPDREQPKKEYYKDFLSPFDFKEFTVKDVKQLTHDTKLLRFYLPNNSWCFDIPVGSHIQIRATIGEEKLIRNYTPTSIATDEGYFDLVVKRYEEGRMSVHLHSLRVGNTLEVRGPSGRFRYAPNMYHTVCMIAGGTGLTPVLQIAKTILRDTHDKTVIHMLYANRTEEDIIQKEELAALRQEFVDRFNLYHCISKPTTPGWGDVIDGRIDLEKIKKYLPAPTEGIQALICGSYTFCKAMKAHLTDANYTREMVYMF